MNPVTKTHLLIIGAGPVGLFSVFMGGMVGLSCCVLEASNALGGQCQTLYPEKPIYDIPGFKSVLGKDLVLQLWNQAKVFEPKVFFSHRAEALVPQEHGRWLVHTDQGQIFDAGAILLCVGQGSFQPIRPSLDNLEHFEKTGHVLYQIEDPSFFAGKSVVIAGGGDSAIDWAILLSSIAAQTNLVHRRQDFRAQDHSLKHMEHLVSEGKIHLHTPAMLDSLHGQDHLTHVSLNVQEGSCTLQADYLLPFFGIQPCLGPILSWGLAFEKGRILVNPTTGETNLPGIYGAGDGIVYAHKLKLILTGFSEVAQAIHHIKGYLFPEKRFSFQHSTHTGLNKNLL